MSEYVDANGQPLTLGSKLGSGGEGAVYELPSLNAAVKIYHQPLSAEKQKKLQALVSASTPALLKVAAWPIALVYKTNQREICGLVMPKLSAYEPLHHLYSPAQRKQKFPDKSWAFLLHVARNMASVFAVIHAHGHVIGDVNPNLVYVDGKGLIRLIDCDSFQITHDQQTFACDVGVPHFTAPELQQQTSFRGLVREANQDNFGLAMLIFHLLLMGRHPYAGVRADRSDCSLEQAIAQYAYAFADDAAQKGLSPPPNSISPAILPPALRQFFSQAFNDNAQNNHPSPMRPTPPQWVEALTVCQTELQRCQHASLHSYWRGLAVCPWCAHQERAGVYFFLALADETTSTGGFDLAVVWVDILAVQDPPLPVPAEPVVERIPWSPQLRQQRRRYRSAKLLLLLLWSAAFLYWPWQVECLIFIVTTLLLPGINLSAELQQRKKLLKQAQYEYQQWQDKLQRLSTQHALFVLRQRLRQARAEYESMSEQFLRAQKGLKDQLRQRQLQKFLDGFLVNDTTIPNIGLTRRAMLLSFGVETAADVEAQRIRVIPGFSEKLSYELLDWRERLQAWFVFDAKQGVDPQDITALKQKFAFKRTQLQAELQAGVGQLKSRRADLQQQYQQLQPVLDEAYRRMQQMRLNQQGR